MVRDAQPKEDLQQKMANLIKDHEHLFHCQVGPEFEIEAAQCEIPSVNAWIARKIVPFSAARIRNWELRKFINERWGPFMYTLDFRNRRRALFERRSFNDTIKNPSDALDAMGFVPPKAGSLRTHINNWQVPSSSPENLSNSTAPSSSPDSGVAEFSSNVLSPITILRSLSNTKANITTTDRSSDLTDLMALSVSYRLLTAWPLPLFSRLSIIRACSLGR
jgi:hypothetical protein